MKALALNLTVSIILCTIIIGLLIYYENNKHKRHREEENERFWNRESDANSVRKKDISSLPYLKLPFNSFPYVDTTNYNIIACQRELKALDGAKIINLSSMSNTDLKMEYGAANLPILTQYDDNYSQLIKILSNLGSHLAKEGFHKEAIYFLELGIECGSDISRNFYTLADEYIITGNKNKILSLIEKATALNSAMAPSIAKNLTDKLNS